MSGEADAKHLQDRVNELEAKVEKLSRSPGSLLPWWRKALHGLGWGVVAVGASHGVVATVGPLFMDGGPAVHTYAVYTHSVKFREGLGDSPYHGVIDGRDSSIRLTSEEGEIRIDPKGIRIEGPDGTLILKPEKK
jgi:hypothetical protein